MALGRPIRYRCDISARLEFEGSAHPVRIIDLSETGVFVETDLELQYGDKANVAIALPGGAPWVAAVTVVRLGSSQREVRHPRVETIAVSRVGVGLKFDAVPDDEVERLRGFLEILDER